ncbi:MAG: ComF family protein [Paracoccaceae bacterium]
MRAAQAQHGPLRALIRLVYPPGCLACAEAVEGDGALCPTCWRDMPFVAGAACGTCGAPLPGEAEAGLRCDDCLTDPPPWDAGVAVAAYAGTARRLAMAFKHGDRTEMAPHLGAWMAARLRPQAGTVVVPVPLHWRRRVRRRYNQAALLAGAVAGAHGLAHRPDALRRVRATAPLDGIGRAQRHERLTGAIAPSRPDVVSGRPVLLIDDVMTTGATLRACAGALRAAGAGRIEVAVLARVAMGD